MHAKSRAKRASDKASCSTSHQPSHPTANPSSIFLPPVMDPHPSSIQTKKIPSSSNYHSKEHFDANLYGVGKSFDNALFEEENDEIGEQVIDCGNGDANALRNDQLEASLTPLFVKMFQAITEKFDKMEQRIYEIATRVERIEKSSSMNQEMSIVQGIKEISLRSGKTHEHSPKAQVRVENGILNIEEEVVKPNVDIAQRTTSKSLSKPITNNSTPSTPSLQEIARPPSPKSRIVKETIKEKVSEEPQAHQESVNYQQYLQTLKDRKLPKPRSWLIEEIYLDDVDPIEEQKKRDLHGIKKKLSKKKLAKLCAANSEPPLDPQWNNPPSFEDSSSRATSPRVGNGSSTWNAMELVTCVASKNPD